MAITQKQAEQALACVRQQFKDYIDIEGTHPVLIENWRPPVPHNGHVIDGDPIPFVIAWEEGPSDWAFRARTGGRDVELTLELRSVPGVSKDAVVDTAPADHWPTGVHEEPYYSYVLGLYED